MMPFPRGDSDIRWTTVYHLLVDCLDEDESWKVLANSLKNFANEALYRVRDLEAFSRQRSPAKALIDDLSTRAYKVEHFIWLFENCDLLKTLLLLKPDQTLVIVEQPDERSDLEALHLGDPVQLVCVAEGFPYPMFQWIKDGQPLCGETASLLTRTQFCIEDIGVYKCHVTPTPRPQTRPYTVTSREILVQPQNTTPSFKECESSQLRVHYGETVTLTSQVTGFPPPRLQWFQDNKHVKGGDCDSLTIVCSSYECAGIYRCRARNDAGESWSEEIEVKIIAPSDSLPDGPQIVVQPNLPNDHPLRSHSCISLCCAAKCAQPLCFRWYCNGKEIKEDDIRHKVTVEGQRSRLYVTVELGPDGVTSWQYVCRVELCRDSSICELSRFVDVKLDLNNENPRYTVSMKAALILANSNYPSHRLRLPEADALTLQNLLTEIGFYVFTLVDLTRDEMLAALHQFCAHVKPEAYVVVYTACHGVVKDGQEYIWPCDLPAYYSSEDCVCLQQILRTIQERCGPSLTVIIADLCRKTVSQESLLYKEHSPPKYPVLPYQNYIIAYATSLFYNSHEDTSESNGIYMKYLKKHLLEKLPVHEMIRKVNNDLQLHEKKCISSKQPPNVSHNLIQNRGLCDEVDTERYDSALATWWHQLTVPPEAVSLTSGTHSFTVHFRFIFTNVMKIKVVTDPRHVDCCVRLDDPTEVFNIENCCKSHGHHVFLVRDLQRATDVIHLTLKVRCSGGSLVLCRQFSFSHPITALRLTADNSVASGHK